MNDAQTTTGDGLRTERIHFLDEVRGFDLILMVFFHGFYTIGYLFGWSWGRTLFQFFAPSEAFFAGVFIFLCGLSCRLSRNNWKRGLLLLGVAAALSLAMGIAMPEEMIWFGILHFLAVSILLFALLRPLLDKLPPLVGMFVCAALLLLTWWVPAYRESVFGIPGLFTLPVPETWREMPLLYPLGFSYVPGADYFPLLPWIFCFLGGSYVGIWAKQGRFPRWMIRRRIPALSWIGRHTLIIYILHQPVIYAVCWIVYRLLGGAA